MVKKLIPETRYISFSSIDGKTLYDTDAIKRDLLNHFHTRKGERVMNPEFGSVIWDMLYENMTEANIELIIEDSKNIINSDPRIKLQDISIDVFEHGITLLLDVYFNDFYTNELLKLDFDKNNN